MSKQKAEVFRNVCPRNCYNSCSMLSYVKDGKLQKVTGDPKHGYTQGKLCAKGYAYTEYVYSPDRIRYPLRQYPRGSGKWEKITWGQAIEQIACSILEIHTKYGSNLPAAYNKCSGNIGLMHYAVEAMFNSIGAHTKPMGNPCLSAGQDAMSYDFGTAAGPDPEKMIYSKLIIIWGANPAWTAVHQMKFINTARQRGAKLVVIDPLYTQTAAKADLYLQIRPGTDGLLALAIAKLLIERDEYDKNFVEQHVWGFEPFCNYLQENSPISYLDWISQATGVQKEGILELTSLLSVVKPCSTWIGFGLQRSANGGQNTRAINALMAITGNIGVEGGGLYYLHQSLRSFPLNLLNHQSPQHDKRLSRKVNINNFASALLHINDPPVKFLWLAGRNVLSQDQDLAQWLNLLSQLELVVTVDLFMTKTAEASDLLLPAASHFEEHDLNVSYWHHWLAINEQAISPYYEAKSDLQIARDLTQCLNKLSPNFSNFKSERSAKDWIELEFTPEVLELYNLKSWKDLKDGPCKLQGSGTPWSDKRFPTKTGKFEIYSEKAKRNSLPAISKYKWPKTGRYPLRLLSPQNLLGIHSQYEWLTWFEHDSSDWVQMNERDAHQRNLTEGNTVRIYNQNGWLNRKVHISRKIPPGVVVVYQGGTTPINTLIAGCYTDMGSENSGSNNIAFYETSVECQKSR